MLKFDENQPVKQTYAYLAKFPRFSLIQKLAPAFVPTSHDGCLIIANIIKEQIHRKNKQGKPCILGLATGSSPLGIYRQLIKMYQKQELSFKNVVTFNLDQYYPLKSTASQSYRTFMNENLFKHIDIPIQNTNVPNGQLERSQITKFCADYEKKIKSYGGIDIQILGIGRTGHIGFNEPPSPINSITRLVYLNKLTRTDAAKQFGGYQKVPKCAITMGIQTIKKAKKIIIMAWSQTKAEIVKKTLQGEITPSIPATFLHGHHDVTFFIDKAASEFLTRFNTPWVIKGDIQDPIVPKSKYWIIKSVTWLAQTLNKPLLRLTYDDYEEHHLSELVVECANGCVQDLNLYVYKKILKRITGWPLGGRPAESQQVEMASMPKKVERPERVLIFSPHPDDDVISMGGTLKTLYDQGHQVNVAYMTSGSNGVLDIEARKYMYFLKDFSQKYFFKLKNFHKGDSFISEYNKLIEEACKSFETDTNQEGRKTEINLAIKQFIRSSQAKIALNSLGLHEANAYSLELPFYGSSHKNRLPIGQGDYEVIRSLLRLVQPTAVYAAGDLSDPHGTHRKCLQILIHIFDEEQQKIKIDPTYQSLYPPPEKFFLYRGAWTEWQISMARIIIPLSPKIVNYKTQAILKHQSQKDGAKYLGEDKREFWQRAKQRNRNTADLLNKLGFSNYEACECFVNLDDLKKYDEL